jgi:hypothetical protein
MLTVKTVQYQCQTGVVWRYTAQSVPVLVKDQIPLDHIRQGRYFYFYICGSHTAVLYQIEQLYSVQHNTLNVNTL